MGIRWVSDGYPMGIRWVSDGYPMGIRWVLTVVWWGFQSHHGLWTEPSPEFDSADLTNIRMRPHLSRELPVRLFWTGRKDYANLRPVVSIH